MSASEDRQLVFFLLLVDDCSWRVLIQEEPSNLDLK